MLFSSFEFVFLFLPAVLLLFGLARLHSVNVASVVILSASLYFYAYLIPAYVLLIGTSVTVNYFVGQRLMAHKSMPLLSVIVGLNLLALGYFKYADFLIGTVNGLFGLELPLMNVELPLAISFFTFQQIAYVVDCYKSTMIPCTWLRYAVFVSFFPHLIAGPIVRQQQVMADINAGRMAISAESLAHGLSIFIFGLFKKVVFADTFGDIADPIFGRVEAGESISLPTAWLGALAYSLQIYFDFSAYSDMAIGLARMFGLQFPLNFDSPYKSASIIEFWRRWHMTLSGFLREYLYYPLGGNRGGSARRYLNLMIVMLLGGLWHGAGWAFVIWGGLHGLYLVINHGWRNLSPKLPAGVPRFHGIAGRAVTFIAVVLAWIPFRAADMYCMDFYNAMFAGAVEGSVQTASVAWIALGLLICWSCPNVAEIFGIAGRSTRWSRNPRWVAITAMVFVAAFVFMMESAPHAFIYFQF